jgi:hypothetical protein
MTPWTPAKVTVPWWGSVGAHPALDVNTTVPAFPVGCLYQIRSRWQIALRMKPPSRELSDEYFGIATC